MTEPLLFEITDYDSLIAAIRAAKAKRGLSDTFTDELAGLTRGHTQKLLGPQRSKNLSPMTLSTLLSTLAVKLVLVEDPEIAAQMEGRWEQRDERRVRADHRSRANPRRCYPRSDSTDPFALITSSSCIPEQK